MDRGACDIVRNRTAIGISVPEVTYAMNWLFWVLLIPVVGYLVYQQWWLRRGLTHVAVHDIKAYLDARHPFFLVDVRESAQYNAGHIPTAVSVPLDRLEQEAEGWDRTREVLIICTNGTQSVLACRRLAAKGFTRVRNVEGGMRRWPWGRA
ncbi:MAG TPA: rhodanese-like domain-containing protein [Symbiobacteriaceae bacterium]|nr:rhodanese-like domain-containing protein [Symbiobacteriaceae bacterium]